MSDDLNIILVYICASKHLHRIAIKIEHGLNSELSDAFTYYGEPGNQDKIMKILPPHIKNHIDTILEVIEINDIIIIKDSV